MKFAISCDENPGDPGTTAGGIIERDLNIKVGNQLVPALRRCGQEVWFDTSITAGQRVARANSDGTDVIFVCSHNYSVGGMGEGAIFIFCDASAHSFGKQLLGAHNVGAELVAAGLVGGWRTVDEYVYECCAFNRDTIWCEFAYQSNAQDLAVLRQPDYPVRAAEAACRGLAKTYGFAYIPPATPAPPEGDEDMLFVGSFHASPATVKTFSGGNVYALPSAASPVVATFPSDQQIGLKGYRFSSSSVASSDRGAGAGAGPDYVWWESDSGHWYPDADLNTTSVQGAPIGAAVSTLPAGMRSYFVTVDDPASGTAPTDDDSSLATKAYVDQQDAIVKATIPTKATTVLA